MEEQEFCLDGRKPRSLKPYIHERRAKFPSCNKKYIEIYIDFLYNQVNYSRLVAIV